MIFDETHKPSPEYSVKWRLNKDGNFDCLTISDLDFNIAECISEALKRRISIGHFGYSKTQSSDWFDAILRWNYVRHKYKIKPSEPLGF